jgi:hypothetical protein
MMRFASHPILPVSSESNPAELSEPIINICLDGGAWADRRNCALDQALSSAVSTEQATHAF